MSDLIDTTEMYLRTIYELVEEGVPPLRARIAERLSQSGPTVSQTVARMERDHLLVVHPDRQLELSEHGWELATAVMRKHRLAECLLTDVIGLDLALVHDEACRWEHVVSHAVEQRITDLLDAPERSPYGNRIPRLDVADLRAQAEASASTATLAEVLAGPGEASVVLDRISEFAQADAALLALLLQAGLRPGVTLVADRDEDGLRLRCADAAPDAGVEVGLDVAHLLFVGVPRR